MKMHTIGLEFQVSEEFLNDVFTTAIEGGSNYWCRIKGKLIKPNPEDACTWYYDSAYIEEFGDEEEAQSSKTILPSMLRKGIKIILTRAFGTSDPSAHCHINYSKELYAAVAENDTARIDADLADLILQCTYFGHIVYG